MADIDIGAITEALNDKSDRDFRNVDNTAGADAVIEYQLPTAENNYTWYRKYKSGWVEQGGVSSNATTSGVTVNLPVTMLNTNYSVFVSPVYGSAYGTAAYGGDERTTTSLKVYSNNNNERPAYWEVKGMAAN